MKIKSIYIVQRCLLIIVCGLFYLPLQAQETVIENGKLVSLELVINIAGEEKKSADADAEPVRYYQGNREIPEELEKALAGLKVDDTTTVTLTPEQAYGVVNPNAFLEFDMDAIPEKERKVGNKMILPDSDGVPRYVRVHELREGENKMVLDFNHPLAGKTVIFEARVLAIE